ncbi:hypothetical protein JCM8547_002590 [Rhodosporidiobolus lusitaniae]
MTTSAPVSLLRLHRSGPGGEMSSRTLRPLPTLPAEILLQILTLSRNSHIAAIPSFSSSPVHHSVRRRLNPILAASHVCKAWRVLTRGNSTLWSVLHLDGEIDGGGAEGKALFWAGNASRAKGSSVDGADEGDEEGGGIQTLVLTNIQHWSDDAFSYLCESFELVNPVRLSHVHLSFMGVSSLSPTPSDENKHLQSAFKFLLFSSSSSLTSLTLSTPSHLRILFSLPRLGHSFTSLTSLSIESTKISSPTVDAYLLPTFLPRYSGESDWRPLASLRHLTLVGPIWRLRYRDGTVASPTLEAADVPNLEYARLGNTSPQVHWDLLSSESVRELWLEDWYDNPHLDDPDLMGGFAKLSSLSLVRSPTLVTRLLDLALSLPGFSFPNLTHLNFSSARLSQAHLDLFSSSERAPQLSHLVLSDTTSASSFSLSFPSFPSLMALTIFRISWTISEELVRDVVHRGKFPRLEELRSDLKFGESGERGLRAVGVRLVREEEEDEE